MAYDLKHMEDWDFAETCEVNDGRLHGEARTFVQSTHVVARDALRVQLLWGAVERGYADFDGTFVTLRWDPREAEAYFDGLRGSRSTLARFRKSGRALFEVVESLRREYRRDGRLRLTRLPPDLTAAILGAPMGAIAETD